MSLGDYKSMQKEPGGPADAPGHVGMSVEQLEDELEKARAGYAALVQAVQTVQVFKDVDINWDEFPSVTLSAAHEENEDLKKILRRARGLLGNCQFICRDIDAALSK